MEEKNLRIAFLLPAVISRGPIIYTHYLLMGLKKRVKNVEVFYFKGQVEYDLGVKCTKISRYKAWDFSNFDIIHSTMGVPDIYAALFCKKEIWITSMHSYNDKALKMEKSKFRAWFILFIWEKALAKAKNVIVSSRQMQEYYENYIGDKNYKIIPYGIVEREYQDVYKEDIKKIKEFKNKGYTIIGSVGLLNRRKGFHQIIRLLQIEKKSAAIIVGEGSELSSLCKLANEIGVADRVFFPGYRDDSYNYYQYIDIYAHVSYSEGFGLALLEAMSKGKPIICSKLDIYKDYFSENEVAYFDVGNISSLKKAYNKINKHLEAYSEASYRLYQNTFSLENMTSEHIEYYRYVLENKEK